MVGKAVLLMTGAAIGVAGDRIALELRKAPAEQVPGLRRIMNQRVNPWLVHRRYPGSEHAELGTLEHIGRVSGARHLTVVHPTLRGQLVFVPAPLGDGSHWVRNVRADGRARLNVHGELFDLDRPELISTADSGLLPPPVAALSDRLGWRYVRFHVAARVPGWLRDDTDPTRTEASCDVGPLEPFAATEPTTPEPVGAG
jgi:hypothetical protein